MMMMTINRLTLSTAAAGLALFAAGITGGIALHSSLDSPAESASDDPGGDRAGPLKRDRLHTSSPSSPVTLDELSEETNLLQRSRMLNEMTAGATAAECRNLLEQLKGDDLAVAQIAARWAEIDPRSLFDFLESGGAGSVFAQSDEIINELFAAWSKSDPEGAFAAARQTPSFQFRNRCVTELIGNMLYVDPKAAMAMVSRSIAEGDEVLGQFRRFGDWADADRSGAADLIMTLPRCKFRMRLAADLCRRWGVVDPEAAVRFAEQLDPEARDRGIESTFVGWLDYDFDAARQYIEAAGGSTRARLSRQLVTRMAQRDPDGAFAWIDSHLDGAPRRGAIEASVNAGVARHPATVARHVADLPVGELKRSAMRTTARAWFESDAERAAEWLQNMAPGFARDAGLEGLRQARIPEQQRTALMEVLLSAGSETD